MQTVVPDGILTPVTSLIPLQHLGYKEIDILGHSMGGESVLQQDGLQSRGEEGLHGLTDSWLLPLDL